MSAFLLLGAFAAWQAVEISSLRERNAALSVQTKNIGVMDRSGGPPPPPGGMAAKAGDGKPSAAEGKEPGKANPEETERVAREARFREMRTLDRTQRIDARILALKTKLNLTPEQETAVRAAMEKGSLDRDALREAGDARRRAGGAEETDKTRQAEMAKFAAVEAAQEKAITGAMTDEQLTAYDQYKAEQKATQVESRANQQLSDLQGKLSLTDAQKDAAFQFYAAQEQAGGFDPAQIAAQGGDPRKFFEDRQNLTLEAMQQILTPEQYELYSKQETERAALFRNGGGFGGGFGGPRGGGGGPPGPPPGRP